MGRRIVFALFALFAIANVAGAVEATAEAVREPSLHSWLVGGYWVLKLGVESAFMYFVAVRRPRTRWDRAPGAGSARPARRSPG